MLSLLLAFFTKVYCDYRFRVNIIIFEIMNRQLRTDFHQLIPKVTPISFGKASKVGTQKNLNVWTNQVPICKHRIDVLLSRSFSPGLARSESRYSIVGGVISSSLAYPSRHIYLHIF